MGKETGRARQSLTTCLSIVVPVYHEQDNICKLFDRLRTDVKTSYQLLIVYDRPDDPTLPVVNTYTQQHPVILVKLVRNNVDTGRGVINAIKTGLRAAKDPVVLIMMADLCDDTKQIDQMYHLIQKDGYDIVAASRYMPGGKKMGGGAFKTFLSKMAGFSLYYLFRVPTRDATNAFKMYRRSIFDRITIDSTGGFEYSLEIILKAFRAGYKITEIPTVWTDRTSGQSQFKLLRWLPKYAGAYLKNIRSKKVV